MGLAPPLCKNNDFSNCGIYFLWSIHKCLKLNYQGELLKLSFLVHPCLSFSLFIPLTFFSHCFGSGLQY